MKYARKAGLIALGTALLLIVVLGLAGSSKTNIPKPQLPKISIAYGSERENATFVVLAENKDLEKLAVTIQTYEMRFNQKYNYNWVFFNEKPFEDEFKHTIGRMVSGKAEFGTIPKDMWDFPEWIDREEAKKSFKKQGDRGIGRAAEASTHLTYRFESGLFYKHPLMRQYKYYWRVEPGTKLLCDIGFDVFKYMSHNDLKYSFTLSNWEEKNAVDDLWDRTLRWANENPQYVNPNSLARMVTGHDGKNYNMFQFFTNFEIANMDFWRGEAYSSYFEFLDRSGGFFYQRWSDAPVHSIAAALLLDRDEVAHFDFIGYEHSPFTRTPMNFKERGMTCATRNRRYDADFDRDFSSVGNFYFAQNMNSMFPLRFKNLAQES